jgi:hypothetical protein
MLASFLKAFGPSVPRGWTNGAINISFLDCSHVAITSLCVIATWLDMIASISEVSAPGLPSAEVDIGGEAAFVELIDWVSYHD